MRPPRSRLSAQKTTKNVARRIRTTTKATGAVKVSPITRKITREISADRREAMRELANR